jgi:hypothetical protein
MIRYQLRCSRGHGFEGWFKSSGAFDEEVQAVTCPICDDPSIEKAIMAPSVLLRGDKAPPVEIEGTTPSQSSTGPAASGPDGAKLPATAPVAALPQPSASPIPLSPEQAQLAKTLILMRKLKAHVEANFENVGRRFADEARKIHYEETEPRGIFGEASPDEVQSLEEEGIAIAPLPNLPKLDG